MIFDAIAIPLPDSESLRAHMPPPLPRVRRAKPPALPSVRARATHAAPPSIGWTSAEISVLRDKRRNSARMRLHMPVNITRASDLTSRILTAFDIGLGGMQCVSKIVVFPGTYVDLAFRLPGTRELLKVGAQVASLSDSADGSAVLGLRFCRLSARAQLSIYRFLDKRRERWTSQGENTGTDDSQAGPRPFEGLLKDAYGALQAEELRELGFVCTPWPQNLMPSKADVSKAKDVKPVTLQ